MLESPHDQKGDLKLLLLDYFSLVHSPYLLFPGLLPKDRPR